MPELPSLPNFSELPNLLSLESFSTVALVGIAIFLCITILRKPVGWIFRILANTLIGFILLFAVNAFGGFIGVSLGINWFNAVIVGVFGLPGVGLLLILQWLLII